MTLRELYDQINGSYEQAMEYNSSEAAVRKKLSEVPYYARGLTGALRDAVGKEDLPAILSCTGEITFTAKVLGLSGISTLCDFIMAAFNAHKPFEEMRQYCDTLVHKYQAVADSISAFLDR